MTVTLANIDPAAVAQGLPTTSPLSFDIESDSGIIDFVLISVQYITGEPEQHVIYESDGFTKAYAPASTIAGEGTTSVSCTVFEFGDWRDRVFKITVTAVADGEITHLCPTEFPAVAPPTESPFMTLMQTVEALGGDVADLTFSGLEGDTDGIYHIEYHVKQAINSDIFMFLNGSNAGRSRRDTVNSSTAAFGTTMVALDSSAIGDFHEGRIIVNAPTSLAGVAKRRFYRNYSYFEINAGSIFSRLYSGRFDNTVDEITSIALAPSGGNAIAEGSWARLYKYTGTPIATVEVTGGPVSRIDITGLDGDTDGIYHIEYYINAVAASRNFLQFNDDAVNAIAQRHWVRAPPAVARTTLDISEHVAINEVHEGTIIINAPATLGGVARKRQYRAEAAYWADFSSVMQNAIYEGEWNNTVDSINKISIVNDLGANIAEGSWVRIYKYAQS